MLGAALVVALSTAGVGAGAAQTTQTATPRGARRSAFAGAWPRAPGPSCAARRALRLELAGLATGLIPVTVQGQALDGRHVARRQRTGRAAMDVLLRHIDEVLFAEPAVGLGGGGQGLGHISRHTHGPTRVDPCRRHRRLNVHSLERSEVPLLARPGRLRRPSDRQGRGITLQQWRERSRPHSHAQPFQVARVTEWPWGTWAKNREVRTGSKVTVTRRPWNEWRQMMASHKPAASSP